MIDYDTLTIKEFLGVILIFFPIYLFITFSIIEFIARIRERFSNKD